MASLRVLMTSMGSPTVQIYIWIMQVNTPAAEIVSALREEFTITSPDVERKKFHLAADLERNIEVQVWKCFQNKLKKCKTIVSYHLWVY